MPGQGGAHHVNEQWPTYWHERLAARSFDCFDLLRLALWEDDRIEWWYRQNVLVYARGEAAERLQAAGHRAGVPLRLAHPVMYEQAVVAATRERGLREVVGARLRRGLR